MELTAFDALEGGTKPTDCFGPILTGTSHYHAMCLFRELRDQADKAVREIFKRQLLEGGQISELDEIISEMWENGWDPAKGDFKLFVVHFGALFTAALLMVDGTTPIFRSKEIIDHISVWHALSRTEYFPFHKVAKCLTARERESLSSMCENLTRKSLGQQALLAGLAAGYPFSELSHSSKYSRCT